MPLIRRLLFGPPIATSEERRHRLSNLLALPVFASDALSSTAYATEEILLALVLVSVSPAVLGLSLPISLAIAALIGIVVISYQQTVRAYPQGGGAYSVASDNLGQLPGLTAAAALLIDYVLTVAVSVASGVAAVTSALPILAGRQVELAIGLVWFMALANLRGVRESGALFAIPAYVFIGAMTLLILAGLTKAMSGTLVIPPQYQPPPDAHPQPLAGVLTPFIVMRAFSSGCAALTGIEAVSNGVTAFRPPEGQNAARVLVWLGAILSFLFVGITFLAQAAHVIPFPAGGPGGHGVGDVHRHTVVSQVALTVFGFGTPLYYLVQASTAAVLAVAANTAFADFPRLSRLLARDGFLPRQLANIGDRLVFSNGIIVLALIATTLLLIFHASTHHLIPLYAVGVFLSFTLSQSGMVVRWWRRREGNWRLAMAVNTTGAVATGIVVIVMAVSKFVDGAWMVVVLIPLMVLLFRKIHHHYKEVAEQLSMTHFEGVRPFRHTVLLLVPDVHRGIMQALAYARTISPHIRAVYIEIDPTRTQRMLERWQQWVPDIPLVVLPSPYRGLVEPLMRYLDEVEAEREDDVITVVIPEFVTPQWWSKLLHNQSGLLLKFALLFRKNVVVTNVRYYLEPRVPASRERAASEPAPLVKAGASAPRGEGSSHARSSGEGTA